MLYEIHTTESKYQFESPDQETAAFVTIIIGRSMYKAVCVNDIKKDVPILFNNSLSWFQEKFNQSVIKFMEDNGSKIKKVLESVKCIESKDNNKEEDLEAFAKAYIQSLPL